MNRQCLLLILLIFGAASCDRPKSFQLSDSDLSNFVQAKENGRLANHGYIRCRRYLEAWMQYRDPESGLIPRNIEANRDYWNAKDAAADNYPFMVLSAFFVRHDMMQEEMLDILNQEKNLTSRLRSLPDTWSFTKQGFLQDEVHRDEIVFGASEYIKDGLLPLTEWLGQSPWSDRMLEMLYDLQVEIDVAGSIEEHGYGKAPREEVNGELLQVLSRVYWMTGDESLLSWALTIADFYLLGNQHPTRDLEYLRLRDHGCELVAGLCEIYITTHFARKDKKMEYQQPLYNMLDRILEVGRNDDGFFYDAVNPVTGEIIEPRIADTWGYTLNGFYGVYLIDNKIGYKEAVLKLFSNLHKYKNYNWEGNADGYADAIESALNLYNRITDYAVSDWIDSEIQVMWAMQREDGIIEGWHGDGNFARTTIMHNLWKSKGIYVQPWRDDIILGAESKGDTLFVVIEAEKPWVGKIIFDKQRSVQNMNLPMDWPRINQFPEWFVAVPDQSYLIHDIDQNNAIKYRGADLIAGIEFELEGAKRFILICSE